MAEEIAIVIMFFALAFTTLGMFCPVIPAVKSTVWNSVQFVMRCLAVWLMVLLNVCPNLAIQLFVGVTSLLALSDTLLTTGTIYG